MDTSFEGKWHEIRGEIKGRWGRLSHDEINKINGHRDELLNLLQKKYGYAKEKALDELRSFEKTWGCTFAASAPSSEPQQQAHSHEQHRETTKSGKNRKH